MGLLSKINILRNCNWLQFKKNILYLMEVDLYNQEQELIYRLKDETIEDCITEFDDYCSFMKQLYVLNSKQTIELLKNEPKSFTRFGDGEIHIMQGINQAFQKADDSLADKLFCILNKKRDDIYVGLNHAYWESPIRYAERNRRFYRIRGTAYRRFFTENCNENVTYLDAACFGAYYRFDEDFNYKEHYKKIKSLFENKKIAIVAGDGVFEKLEFNVFENAIDIIKINAPRINAFSEYNSILADIDENVPKDYLICLILGQTATAMVPDLTDLGYMAWDVGHVAKDYDEYMKKKEKTEANMEAFWAPD